MITKTYKVYGISGHRQRESFHHSDFMDFSRYTPDDIDIRTIEILNNDVTGTNEFSVIRITRNTEEEVTAELQGQLSDGIFENSRHGEVEEVANIVYDEDHNEINFDAAAYMMDDDIRMDLHLEMAPCSKQAFFDAYCRAHREKYGEEFTV